jgi:repressor LexA
MEILTDRQTEVVSFIENYIARNQYPPSIRDIADNFNITSRGAHDHIKAIEKKGYIARSKKVARSIRIIER